MPISDAVATTLTADDATGLDNHCKVLIGAPALHHFEVEQRHPVVTIRSGSAGRLLAAPDLTTASPPASSRKGEAQ